MRRLTLIASLLLILLGGCQSSQTTPTVMTPSSTQTPTPTLTPTATSTSPPPTSPAPTTPPDTLTPTPASQPLPALREGQNVTITEIHMVTTTQGWAIGYQDAKLDHVLYTEDGGETWFDRSPPITISQSTEQTIHAKGFFLDENHGWAKFYLDAPPPPLAPQYLWRTTDAGKTWQISQPLPLLGEEFYFIPTGFTFLDPDQGWLLVNVDSGMNHEYSSLYTSKDGGVSWERILTPPGNGLQIAQNTAMLFANENLGWVTKDAPVVAKGPFIEKTTDGGYAWNTYFLPAPENINFDNDDIFCKTYSPAFTSSQTRLLLLSCQHTEKDQIYQYVYATTDSGESWQIFQLPSEVFELEFLDFETGYAFGRDIYKTVNGGENWEKVKSVTWEGQFSFVDENHGWAVARKEDDISLVFTENGAQTWQMLEPIISLEQDQ